MLVGSKVNINTHKNSHLKVAVAELDTNYVRHVNHSSCNISPFALCSKEIDVSIFIGGVQHRTLHRFSFHTHSTVPVISICIICIT